MKKIFALVIAIALTLALAVPALADGEDAAVFGTELNLVANDPTVEYDEWDVPYNVWNVIPADTKLNVGDTVTLALSYTVPAAVEGYSERMLSSIEYLTSVEGIDGLTLVEAHGCPGKMQCDYEHGYCMPIPGEYSNVAVEGNVCTVMAELDSDVTVILRGTLTAETVVGSTSVTIGQYRFPAQFSLGTVDKSEANGLPAYNMHRSDFDLVQKRAVEVRADETGSALLQTIPQSKHSFRSMKTLQTTAKQLRMRSASQLSPPSLMNTRISSVSLTRRPNSPMQLSSATAHMTPLS